MIHKRFTSVIFNLIMSFLMALVMSAVLVTINVGIGPDFLQLWMRSFGLAFVVAFPAALVIEPLSSRLTAWLIKD